MNNTILTKVKKYVPTYWPLQSFIATNPLFNLIEQPLDECLSDLGKYIDINGSESIQQYHQYYMNGEISLHNLELAIREFLSDKHLDSNYATVLQNTLINPQVQHDLEYAFNKSNQMISILYSNQVAKDKNHIQSERIKVKLIKFLADFLDLGQAKWDMPVRSDNLYLAWREYSIVEDKYIRQSIEESPIDSEKAIEFLLTKLGIPAKCTEQYLIEILFQVLGWCSIIKWLEERPDNPYIKRTASIADVLAIWLNSEYALLLKHNWTFTIHANLNQSCDNAIHEILKKFITNEVVLGMLNRYTICLIWQRAHELNYRNQLIDKINTSIKTTKDDKYIPSAQFLFCIDTRSEGMRRKLEFIGNYATFGFAGFFGIGFKLFDEQSGACSFQCPAIVVPEITLNNKIQPQPPLKKLQTAISTIFNKTKSECFAPLILFDILGGWFSMGLIGKTLMPAKINKLFKKSPASTYSNKSINIYQSSGGCNPQGCNPEGFNPDGFNPEILAEKANFVLSAIGLKTNFAPFVFICGHIAQSENNPFQASLDCGACGGNGGITNSIVFCQALNDQKVRDILKTKYNIVIPESTFFVSASHNTTTDEFDYYNLDSMDEVQHKLFTPISLAISHAGALLREERLRCLFGEANVDERKSNWAELVPEMALANNAAFIIAPRDLTANLHLERRTFLHSYDPDLDQDGEILNFIFNAPVIVGHWINSQYYFSTTDMDTYGAGNKAIHNVVGKFGVMEGNFSDYKIGLPLQSVAYKNKLVHQPLRLLVVVYAKQKQIDKILANSPILAAMFRGRWAHLEVIEPITTD
ncbi:MAG: uncharacterized protein QG673_1740 [Pseudomonadota bacterium]|nr:uncharacterized protein [Pseudomonadota bacterium]